MVHYRRPLIAISTETTVMMFLLSNLVSAATATAVVANNEDIFAQVHTQVRRHLQTGNDFYALKSQCSDPSALTSALQTQFDAESGIPAGVSASSVTTCICSDSMTEEVVAAISGGSSTLEQQTASLALMCSAGQQRAASSGQRQWTVSGVW